MREQYRPHASGQEQLPGPVADIFGEFAEPGESRGEIVVFVPGVGSMASRDSAGNLYHGVFGDPMGFEDITFQDTMDAIADEKEREAIRDIFGDF